MGIIYAFLFGVLTGIAIVLGGVWYVLSYFFLSDQALEADKPPQKSSSASTFQLPPVLLDKINDESCKSKESCWAVNFVLYFLFRELRNSEHIRRWILRKLSTEFEELLGTSVLGKFFSSITIHNLDLGQTIPVFTWVKTERVVLHPVFKSISTVDIMVDVDYSGGFQFSIQAETHLKKSAFLSIQFKAVKGKARLQFTTEPYAHWSFSFYENPEIDISVVSQLYGKSFSQITAIIASQLKRSVRKKHTLPMFKVRYKPFFIRRNQIPAPLLPQVASEAGLRGNMTVTLIECRGLMPSLLHGNIYASLGVSDFSWVAVFAESDTYGYIVLEIACIKTSKRETELDFIIGMTNDIPVVESVSLKHASGGEGNHHREVSPEIGDEILAVDGKAVSSVKNCLKNHRNSASMRVIWRIKRKVIAGEVESVKAAELGELDIIEKSQMSESSTSNDLSNSSGSRRSSDERGKDDMAAAVTNSTRAKVNFYRMSDGVAPFSGFEVFRSSDIPVSTDPIFSEGFDVNFMENNRYLNITLWTTCNSVSNSNAHQNSPSSSPVKKNKSVSVPPSYGKDKVVGFVSIPLENIITECATTGMGYFAQDIYLGSPDGLATEAKKDNELNGHSGFEPSMCYGKISMSFLYNPDRLARKKESPDSDSASSNLLVNEVGVEATPDSVELRSEEFQAHEFVRSHFRSATVCNYCNKKIWLKEAYMCRTCNMKCHKKCHERCMANTVCRGPSSTSIYVHGVTPEIITTSSDPDPPAGKGDSEDRENQMGLRRRTLGLIASAVQGRSVQLRRVGSASNLVPPSATLPGSSKSLPESPQASPTVSRKGSFSALLNPFDLLTPSGTEMSDDNLNSTVEALILHSTNEDLVSLAKETGRDILADLPLKERKEKLNNMLMRLQEEIDTISNERRSRGSEPNSSPFKTGTNAKSEEQLQAMAILMLHLCSGLQHVEEVEETMQRT